MKSLNHVEPERNRLVEFTIELFKSIIEVDTIKKMPDKERLEFFDKAFEVGYISINPFYKQKVE